jgi:two-component system, NtrC family, sensor kinase
LRARCREVQIVQVLLNLLQNAFVAVSAFDGDKWVAIEVEAREKSITLSVVDSGHGISPGLRDRIMEPFFTTKPVGKGTGLGLSLCRTIALEHGGELRYEAREGHTCFSLILPGLEEEPSLAP